MKYDLLDLDEVCQVKGRIGWKGYKKSDLRENGPLVIGGSNVKNKLYLDYVDLKHLSIEKFEESPEIMLKPDDILVVTRGNVADVGLFQGEFSEATINPSVVILSSIKVNPKYLFYYLISPIGQGKLKSLVSGSSIPAIYQSTLRKLIIQVPSKTHQLAISNILSSLDDKIEVNNKINSTLEELAQTLYKRWFVDFEFPNEEGKPYKSSGGEMVESELGLIPKGWEIIRLGNYFPVLTGKKNANIATETGQYKFFTCSREIYHTDDYSFDAEAILVAGNGDFNVKYYKGKFEAYQRTYVLIPYNSSLTGLLYYAVKKNLSLITAGSRGSVISFITKGNIEDYQIVMPEDDKLYDLSKIFYDYLSLTAINNSESEKLSATRDLLLPKLMSGVIEV